MTPKCSYETIFHFKLISPVAISLEFLIVAKSASNVTNLIFRRLKQVTFTTMCGIFAIFGNACNDAQCNGNRTLNGDLVLSKKHSKESLREMAFRCSSKQRHRGPDKTGIVHFKDEEVVMVHERLRIVGVAHGDQPLQSDNGDITLVANGEIYNFLQISEELSLFYNKQYIARSDCDVIIGLYEKYGDELVYHMTGMFAFALYDRRSKKVFAARDPFGILSMYIGEDEHGNIWVASEMKCLAEKCSYVQNFPTGKFFFHFSPTHCCLFVHHSFSHDAEMYPSDYNFLNL